MGTQIPTNSNVTFRQYKSLKLPFTVKLACHRVTLAWAPEESGLEISESRLEDIRETQR